MEARGAAHPRSAHSQIILTNNVFEFPFYSLTFYYFGSYLISAFAWRMFFRSAIKALRASAYRLKSRQLLLSPIAKSNRKLFAMPKLSSVFNGRACVRGASPVGNTNSGSLIALAACQTGLLFYFPFTAVLYFPTLRPPPAQSLRHRSVNCSKAKRYVISTNDTQIIKIHNFFCSVRLFGCPALKRRFRVPFTIKNYRIKVIMK